MDFSIIIIINQPTSLEITLGIQLIRSANHTKTCITNQALLKSSKSNKYSKIFLHNFT